MKELRALIVDDSNFSMMLIKDMLENKGFEIVATSATVKDAISLAKKLDPDLITMDVTLLDGDGIFCTEQILKENVRSKIIVVSSMKDSEIEKKAKEAGALGYLQKPLEESELTAVLDRIFKADELFMILEQNYKYAFKEVLMTRLQRIIGQDISVHERDEKLITKKSLGISSAIGIIGRHSGRMVLDMSLETLESLYCLVEKDKGFTHEAAISFLSEFANIIAGNAASLLNGLNRGFGLRVAPPTVFIGKDLTMSLGEVSNKTIVIETILGEIFMNIGFKRGDDIWMQSL